MANSSEVNARKQGDDSGGAKRMAEEEDQNQNRNRNERQSPEHVKEKVTPNQLFAVTSNNKEWIKTNY